MIGMSKLHLSVVLATFNEEKNIAKCLEAVKDLADEIVIVDGTSTDKTVEIAKKYGAHVTVTDNPPIFHINKQKAIDKAKGDWILQLDADEVVSKELAEEIREILDPRSLIKEKESSQNSNTQDRRSQTNGYWMPRKNYFLGRFLMKGGQYPDYTVRLYKNGKGSLPQKDVHEQAVIEGKVGYLHHALLHYPYANFSMYLMKWNRYNDLLAHEMKHKMHKMNPSQRVFFGVGNLILKPGHWFVTTYGRHKGFMDSWQGFVFSLFSALRFPVSFIKSLYV
jgi:glycosyltransferase involved in cell wall biosynthesis